MINFDNADIKLKRLEDILIEIENLKSNTTVPLIKDIKKLQDESLEISTSLKIFIEKWGKQGQTDDGD